MGGTNEKPLLNQSDLVEAIKRHFMEEMTVDKEADLVRFLSLKKEEAHTNFALPGVRREGRLRANRAARNQNNGTNGSGANGANGANEGNGGKTGGKATGNDNEQAAGKGRAGGSPGSL